MSPLKRAPTGFEGAEILTDLNAHYSFATRAAVLAPRTVRSALPSPAGASCGTRQASSFGASFLGSRSSELRCFGTERLPNNGFATGEPGSGGPPDRETVVGRPHRRALVSWTGGMGQRCCTPSTPTTKGGNASSGDRSLVGRVPGRRGEPRPASRPGQAAAPVPDGCDSAH